MKKSVLVFSGALLVVSLLLSGCGKESKFNDCYSKLNRVVTEYEQYAKTTLQSDGMDAVQKKMKEAKIKVEAIYREMEEISKDDKELTKRYKLMKFPLQPDPVVKRYNKVITDMIIRQNKIYTSSLNTTSKMKLNESPFEKYGKTKW